MAVELPTEFVVLHRPVLPIDVFAVVVRGLISFVNKEGVFEAVVCPLLFFFADFYLGDIGDIRMVHAGAGAIVFEKGLGGFGVVSLGV